MFARQATYRATVRERGFALPGDLRRPRRRVGARCAARSPRACGPTVPCNNDLLAANFIDDGARMWLIDYEYSGNNDACFELGNTVTECGFAAEQTDAWTEAYFGSPTRADRARVRLQALVQRVRLVAVGLHPGRRQPARLRLPRLGRGALREGRSDVPRPATWPGCCEEVATGGRA